jgi:L-threonylcarbamoyladenylate synthase
LSCGSRRITSLHHLTSFIRPFRTFFMSSFTHTHTHTQTVGRARENDLIIESDGPGLERAAEAIIRGELIAFPTETVYGLGANALNETAVLSIFEAKGRPLTDPLIVHVPDLDSALTLIATDYKTESVFKILGNQFWPGPLTLIVRAAHCIPNLITANTGYVGIRIPAHPLALEFLKKCKLPIAAPSANRFGHVSPTRSQHVLDDLGGKGVHVLNGDSPDYERYTCQHGIESTILKIDSNQLKIYILRQGAISQPEVQDLLNTIGDDQWSVESVHRAVKHQPTDRKEEGEIAPGQLLTHYAPYVPCTVINSFQRTAIPTVISSDSQVHHTILSRYSKESISLTSADLLSTVLIDFAQQYNFLSSSVLAYRDLSLSGNTAEAAKELFDSLRWAENQTNAARVLMAPIICQQKGLEERKYETQQNEDESKKQIQSINQRYDPSLGLADRIFRAASGVAVDIEIN